MTPEAEASASVSQTGGDPLVDNGLGSPLCREGANAELSQAGARNCRSSGFQAAQAPTGNYGFDVHINTGIGKWSNDLDTEILNPVGWSWTLLVALIHLVIVVLEWCYTIDLLQNSAIGGIARGLRETQATFTQPWLVLALAISSILALYHGIIRRQVAQTLGEVVLMGAMMLGGLWVIVNPLGTIGALDAWANEASLGTLAAVSTGTPAHSGRTFGESMQGIFSGAIGGPWCFMEFGNVRWCDDPARLDARLRTAGLQIATKERAKIANKSAEELSAARTNGELFLALPANGPQRNSINDSGSLFNVLCGGSEEPCHGPTAGEAEFRSGSGTLWRVLGLFLFWIGVLGMVLVLGFIALHLLGAAIFSLFYLLLAPAAVIAPALGDGGRAAFRSWGTRLLGAVCAKLIYSFLLGVVLLMQRTLMSFTAFGWAAQWMLVSVMWWWLYLKRHDVDGFAKGDHRGEHHQHRSLLRRARERVERPPEAVRTARWVKDKLRTPPPSVGTRHRIADVARGRAKAIGDRQVGKSLERAYQEAQALVGEAPAIQKRIGGKQARLTRMQREHAIAQADAAKAKSARESALSDPNIYFYSDRKRAEDRFGRQEGSHRRRAASLQGRIDGLQGEIAGEQNSLTAARRSWEAGNNAKRKTGSVSTREQVDRQARLFDAQAALPDRGRAGPGGEKRDYVAAAAILGRSSKELDTLDAGGRRKARLEIDRELAVRKGLNRSAKHVAAGSEGSLGRREQKRTEKQLDRSLEQGMKAEGHELPSSLQPRPKRQGFGKSHDSRARDPRTPTRAGESSVMHDAREVAARRKRQLGREGRR